MNTGVLSSSARRAPRGLRASRVKRGLAGFLCFLCRNFHAADAVRLRVARLRARLFWSLLGFRCADGKRHRIML
jgi:hypothetical protein